MAQSNVDRTYRAWEFFRRRDAEGFMSMCTPDVEFTTFVGEMEGRVYRGATGVQEWFANVDATFDAFSPEVVGVEDLGDTVLAEVLIRGKVGELPLEQRAFQLVEVEGGRVKRWSWYRSREAATAATGQEQVPEESELLTWFRAAYEEGNRAWNQGDFRRAYGALPQDVEYHLGPMWPEARPLRGPDEIAAFFEEWAEAFPKTRTDIREFVPVGERIVVVGIDVSGTGGRSGAAAEMEIWQVWEVGEGLRPMRGREFATRDEALGAANASAEPQAP